MAGEILVSNVKMDVDNTLSILKSDSSRLISANQTSLVTEVAFTSSQSSSFLGPIFEKANVVISGGLTANTTISTSDSGILIFTGDASANSTINFTGLSSMPVGNVASYVVMVRNGASARFINAVQVDGTGVTARWAGGAPTSGTAANTDIYSFNIVKTTATPTYNVFAQVSSFY